MAQLKDTTIDGELTVNGAIQFGDDDYGEAGQVPVSQGPGLPPIWGSSSGGSASLEQLHAIMLSF